jgi:hypothetical protein
MLVPLTRGEYAVIDQADAEAVAAFQWHLHISGPRRVYARYHAGSDRRYLHQFLWRLWGHQSPLVDHRDGDGLNCRRSNLRAATHSQNIGNSRLRRDNRSGLKGVTEVRPGKWRAQFRLDGRNLYLGLFNSPELAHAAYVSAARERFGEFARAS